MLIIKFSEEIINDLRVKDCHDAYMKHPFIRKLGNGMLDRAKFKNYLIQDTLYLKDYGKVYAHLFLLTNDITNLQFLHTCMGVIIADETNMHIKYLKDHDLDVYKIDNMEMKDETRNYLDYMLGFTETGDIKEIFMSVLPCTLTYEYIGKALNKEFSHNFSSNYYTPWIEAYSGVEFEYFSIKSLEYIDSICRDINKEEKERLINIYLKSCEYEMKFWDMSYE